MRALLAVACCMAMTMVAACAGQNATGEDNVSQVLETEQLAQGGNSQVRAERMTVIRDEQALDRVWSEIAPRGDRPAVDFEQDMVLAVFMGERRTGGYQIRVEEVQREGEGIRVGVRMRAPGPNCMTTQALTQPYQIVRLPRVDGPVEFDVEQVEVDC